MPTELARQSLVLPRHRLVAVDSDTTRPAVSASGAKRLAAVFRFTTQRPVARAAPVVREPQEVEAL